jgi:hypothetical protein
MLPPFSGSSAALVSVYKTTWSVTEITHGRQQLQPTPNICVLRLESDNNSDMHQKRTENSYRYVYFNVYVKDVSARGQENENISGSERCENMCLLRLFCS